MEQLLKDIKGNMKKVLRLDKDFHVYIHGNHEKITFLKDNKGKYVKIYYDVIE